MDGSFCLYVSIHSVLVTLSSFDVFTFTFRYFQFVAIIGCWGSTREASKFLLLSLRLLHGGFSTITVLPFILFCFVFLYLSTGLLVGHHCHFLIEFHSQHRSRWQSLYSLIDFYLPVCEQSPPPRLSRSACLVCSYSWIFPFLFVLLPDNFLPFHFFLPPWLFIKYLYS